MNSTAQFSVHRKLKILAYGREHKNVWQTCGFFGLSRQSYYKWKRDYERDGEKALLNSKPCPQNPKIRVPQQVEDLIIYLRTNYYLGQLRISWYLKRYHDLPVSSSGVYSVLKRSGLNPKTNASGPWNHSSVMKSKYPGIASKLM